MDKAKTTKELNEILKHADSEEGLKQVLEHEKAITDGLSFASYYTNLDKVRERNRSDLIRNALLDRTYGYQILNGLKRPSRDKIIALCLAAGLSEKETGRALQCGQYAALYARKRRDAVLIYALDHGFSVMETNELLQEFHEPLLQ